jgi:hypothetical protein
VCHLPQAANPSGFARAPRAKMPRALRRHRGNVARHRTSATARSPQKHQRRQCRRCEQTSWRRQRWKRRGRPHSRRTGTWRWRQWRRQCFIALTRTFNIGPFRPKRPRCRICIGPSRVLRHPFYPRLCPRIAFRSPARRAQSLDDAQTLNVPTHPAPRPHRSRHLVPILIHKECDHGLERAKTPGIVSPFSPRCPSASSARHLFTHHQSVLASTQPTSLVPPSPRRFSTARTALIPHGDVRVRRRVDDTREHIPAAAATATVTSMGDSHEAGWAHRRAGPRGRR